MNELRLESIIGNLTKSGRWKNRSDLNSFRWPYVCILMSLEYYTRLILAFIHKKWGSKEQCELIIIYYYTITFKEAYFKISFRNNP